MATTKTTKPTATIPKDVAADLEAAAAAEKARQKREKKAAATSTTRPAAPVTTVAGPQTTGSGSTTTTTMPVAGAPGTPAQQASFDQILAQVLSGSASAVNDNAVIDMTGVVGDPKKVVTVQAGKRADFLKGLNDKDLESLQRKLWEGGFYTNEFYYRDGKRPAYGSKLDEGLGRAFENFMAVASANTEFKAAQIFDVRRAQNANTISAAGGAGAGASSLNVMVEPTQIVRMPSGDALGAIADAAAQKVLGRGLKKGKERDQFVAMAREMLLSAGMTEADVAAYNRGLTRQGMTQEAAFANEQAANIASGLTGSMADYAAAIRTIESGSAGGNYTAKSKTSTASGAYQVINDTWGKYKGYKTAKDAPPAVQDEFFAKKFGEYVQKYGSPELAAVAWFQGPGVADTLKKGDKSVLAKTDANGMTTNAYIKKFQNSLATITRSSMPPGSKGAQIGGTANVATITGNYEGSVPTKSGGNVLITPSNEDLQATLEAEIEKQNPVEAAAVGFRQGFDVFARLMGGRAYGA